jgi:hypothetical protein
MALQNSANSISEAAMSSSTTDVPRSLLRAIFTDLHFWIPLIVLLAGLVLLDKLR